jgi:beta-N-acetylhexosaminidase
MDDMAGIAGILPAMGEETAQRLERALTSATAAATGDQAELIAKRDALLALAKAAA